MILNALRDHWRDAIEILLLAVVIYQIIKAFRATRGARILVGMTAILLALTLATQIFKFEVIGFIIRFSMVGLAMAAVIIFQPELRQFLFRVGSSRLLSFNNNRRLAFFETFTDAVIKLSKHRIGALFAIQRDISLKPHMETGVDLGAQFSPELALTIFHPKTPLHDGGMIIADDRIAAAGCVFPVSQGELNDRSLGLRHRAGIGVTEESDCIAVIVSEETGAISICEDGKLLRDLSDDEFRERLASLFIPDSSNEKSTPEQLADENRLADPGDRDLVSD